jgi:hypothetical protein
VATVSGLRPKRGSIENERKTLLPINGDRAGFTLAQALIQIRMRITAKKAFRSSYRTDIHLILET